MVDLNTVISKGCEDCAVDAGYVPGLAVVHLPEDPETACGLLAAREQFEMLPDGSFAAELDLPPGMWRYWPEHRAAVWLGRSPDAHPPLRADAQLDLYELILRLAQKGYLLRDLKILGRTGWSRRRRGEAALRDLADEGFVRAVRGVWADPVGRAVRLEIHTTGAMATRGGQSIWSLAEAVGGALND